MCLVCFANSKEKKKKEKKKKEKKHKKDKKKKKKKKKDKKRDKKEKGAVPRDNGMPGPVKITGRVGQVKLIAQNSSFGLVEKKILRLGTGRLPVKGDAFGIGATRVKLIPLFQQVKA